MQPLYTGRNLTAAQDVVNKHVNAFGFVGMQALAEEEEKLIGEATTGFYGQHDQRHAIRWAQTNIEKLGGDPKKVKQVVELNVMSMTICGVANHEPLYTQQIG